MQEIHTQYRKLGITVLSKALDDICPTFQGEAQEEKDLKIRERIKFFARTEVELDKEWEELERDAQRELDRFLKERDTIFGKIEKTNNSEKVRQKILGFEEKKKARVDYLSRKLEREIEVIKEKLDSSNDKKKEQLESKLRLLERSTENKIKKTEVRYNTIIKNTMNSDNSERVSQRLEQSKTVWKRKYNELKEKHLVKETIHNNKRMEFDQIRIAILSFENEVQDIKHWATLSEIPLKKWYTEAVKRGKMIGRDTSIIEEVLQNIISGDI